MDADRFAGFAGGVLFGDSGVEIEYHFSEKPEHERDYNDNDVHALVRLTDGRWAGVHAWCDTTGWDCQAGVTWFVGTRAEVIRDGLTENDRERWGLVIADA